MEVGSYMVLGDRSQSSHGYGVFTATILAGETAMAMRTQ
jgi:hypothetical protein